MRDVMHWFIESLLDWVLADLRRHSAYLIQHGYAGDGGVAFVNTGWQVYDYTEE